MMAAALPSIHLPARPAPPCAGGAAHGKIRRCDCPSRTRGANVRVRGGGAVSLAPVASAAFPRVTLHHPSAVVVVPDVHAAWLSATSLRYNDGMGGMALNKTARNAVEWAAAVLSVKVVATLAATTGPTPLQGAVSGTGAGGGRPLAEGGDGVTAAEWAQPPATALPALSVRLASAPPQFINAVAARLRGRGVRGDGCSGGGSDDLWRSAALGLVLTAVRRVGGSETRPCGPTVYSSIGKQTALLVTCIVFRGAQTAPGAMVVDRSGTNRLPWSSLARVSPNVQVAGGVAAIMGAAAVMWSYRRAVATTPRTVNEEWQAARAKMDLAKERVAGEPVEVNPIRHAAKQKL